MTKYNDHIIRAGLPGDLRANGNNVKARMHEVHADENYAFGAFKDIRTQFAHRFASDEIKWKEFYERKQMISGYDDYPTNVEKIQMDDVFRRPETFKPKTQMEKLEGLMHYDAWVAKIPQSKEHRELYKLWLEKLDNEEAILNHFVKRKCNEGDYCKILWVWMQRIIACKRSMREKIRERSGLVT